MASVRVLEFEDGSTVSVATGTLRDADGREIGDVRTDDGRVIFTYTVTASDGYVIGQASDLRSGCYADADADEGTRSLLGFMGAYVDAITYGVPTYGKSENADLFSGEMGRWVLEHSEELEVHAYDLEECECSEEYGPCEDHSEVLVQREGAAIRTADELCAVFIDDASSLIDAETVRDMQPWEQRNYVAALDTAREYWEANPSGGWAEDEDMCQYLADAVRDIEGMLPSGVSVYWEDGYVITRITGGPLA